jgi:hypothetical protein
VEWAPVLLCARFFFFTYQTDLIALTTHRHYTSHQQQDRSSPLSTQPHPLSRAHIRTTAQQTKVKDVRTLSGKSRARVRTSESSQPSCTQSLMFSLTFQSCTRLASCLTSLCRFFFSLARPQEMGNEAGQHTKWGDMQYKSFRRWVNVALRQRSLQVCKHEEDFIDGLKLYNLLEVYVRRWVSVCVLLAPSFFLSRRTSIMSSLCL